MKIIPQIQEMVDKERNSLMRSYIDMVRKTLDSDKSGSYNNNSQEHAILCMLTMLERAQKHVYVYTDLPLKNLSDRRVLKALCWADYHGVDVHMIFRDKSPKHYVQSQEQAFLWQYIESIAKTFKVVPDISDRKGLREIFMVDDNVRCEFIHPNGEKHSGYLPPNELCPNREGEINIHYQDVNKIICFLNDLDQPSKIASSRINMPFDNVHTK